MNVEDDEECSRRVCVCGNTFVRTPYSCSGRQFPVQGKERRFQEQTGRIEVYDWEALESWDCKTTAAGTVS